MNVHGLARGPWHRPRPHRQVGRPRSDPCWRAKLTVVHGRVVTDRQGPSEQAQSWFLAPARRRALASHGPHGFHEPTDEREQHVGGQHAQQGSFHVSNPTGATQRRLPLVGPGLATACVTAIQHPTSQGNREYPALIAWPTARVLACAVYEPGRQRPSRTVQWPTAWSLSSRKARANSMNSAARWSMTW